MANEAVIIELQKGQNPVRFAVLDGQAIEKGTILQLLDARKVSGATGSGDVVAGIAAAEKVASDGATSIAVYVPGQGNIFDLKNAATGTITIGQMVKTSGANLIQAAADADFEAGRVLGKALEAANASEVIAVMV